jgi:tetratricopeptide (TPR) repeat protein
MRRFLLVSLLLIGGALAQTQPPAPTPPPPAPTPAPAAHHKPQAKSQAEYDAFEKIKQTADPAQAETALAAFEQQFPQSELTPLLYRDLMSKYEKAGNAEKIIATGRKLLALDADDVFALVNTASVLADNTAPNAPDLAGRHDEALKDARHAIELLSHGSPLSPTGELGPRDKQLLALAYAAAGSVELTRALYADAERDLRASTAANPGDPDALVWLRLAVALDHQEKYADALTAADRAVQIAGNGPYATAAKQERERLQKLQPAGTTPPQRP